MADLADLAIVVPVGRNGAYSGGLHALRAHHVRVGRTGAVRTPEAAAPYACRLMTAALPEAVLLDRDGTINVKARKGEYVTRTDDMRLLPGAAEAIRGLNAARGPGGRRNEPARALRWVGCPKEICSTSTMHLSGPARVRPAPGSTASSTAHTRRAPAPAASLERFCSSRPGSSSAFPTWRAP